MKRFLTCALLAMFSAGMVVGCQASGEVGDTDHDGDSSYKKTTTVDHDGDSKPTKTTVKHTD
jgi:hypothetical protein